MDCLNTADHKLEVIINNTLPTRTFTKDHQGYKDAENRLLWREQDLNLTQHGLESFFH